MHENDLYFVYGVIISLDYIDYERWVARTRMDGFFIVVMFWTVYITVKIYTWNR